MTRVAQALAECLRTCGVAVCPLPRRSPVLELCRDREIYVLCDRSQLATWSALARRHFCREPHLSSYGQLGSMHEGMIMTRHNNEFWPTASFQHDLNQGAFVIVDGASLEPTDTSAQKDAIACVVRAIEASRGKANSVVFTSSAPDTTAKVRVLLHFLNAAPAQDSPADAFRKCCRYAASTVGRSPVLDALENECGAATPGEVDVRIARVWTEVLSPVIALLKKPDIFAWDGHNHTKITSIKMQPICLKKYLGVLEQLETGDGDKTENLETLRMCLVPRMIQIVAVVLDKNPRARLVVALKKGRFMEVVQHYLRKFEPSTVTDSTGILRRMKALRSFSAGTTSFRVLITTPAIGKSVVARDASKPVHYIGFAQHPQDVIGLRSMNWARLLVGPEPTRELAVYKTLGLPGGQLQLPVDTETTSSTKPVPTTDQWIDSWLSEISAFSDDEEESGAGPDFIGELGYKGSPVAIADSPCDEIDDDIAWLYSLDK